MHIRPPGLFTCLTDVAFMRSLDGPVSSLSVVPLTLVYLEQ